MLTVSEVRGWLAVLAQSPMTLASCGHSCSHLPAPRVENPYACPRPHLFLACWLTSLVPRHVRISLWLLTASWPAFPESQ